MSGPPAPAARRRVSIPGILTAAGGLVLLPLVVWKLDIGIDEIVADVRQVGWGLAAIVALGGLRFLLRAAAWRLCLDPPHHLRLRDAFAAVICGDAIGNVTPLGPLVGEPAKVAFVRGRVALAPALTALAIENLLYTLSAAAMIAAGMVALLLRFQPPADVRGVGEIAVGGTFVLFAAALWMLWRQPALVSRALGVARPLRKHADRIRQMEEEIYTFASRHRRAFPPRPGRSRIPRPGGRGNLPHALAAQRDGPNAAYRVSVRDREPVDHRRLQVRPPPPRRG